MFEKLRTAIPADSEDEARSRLIPELRDHFRVLPDSWIINHKWVIHPLYSGSKMDADYVKSFYLQKKKQVEKAVKEGDLSRIVMLHERPYRLEAYLRYRYSCLIHHLRSRGSYERWPFVDGDVVRYIWTDTESMHRDLGLWARVLDTQELISGCDSIMNDKDRSFMNRIFPDEKTEVEVYRGGNEENKMSYSWTTSLEKAKWFAHRFGNPEGDEDLDPKVYSVKVNRANVHFCTMSRGECEVVLRMPFLSSAFSSDKVSTIHT